MKPVRMTKGRSLVIFSCYQYKNVMNVAPYNEIAMTIPILTDDGIDLPVLPMVMSGAFKNFGYYVFGMPVTSKENELRGQKIWGLPKLTQEIEITEHDGECVTIARDSNGKKYFELHVPMNGKKTHFDVSGKLFSKKDGQIIRAETNFCGDFNVIKYMGELFRKGTRPEKPYLLIDDCSDECNFSKLLKSLEIEDQPFQFRYAKTMNAAFDLPEKKPIFLANKSSIPENARVTIFGAGAVGASVGGWLSQVYDSVSFYDLPNVRESLKENGLTLYSHDEPQKREQVAVKVVDNLKGSDIIVLAVKNYSLEKVAQIIKEQVGDRALIVALQNGVENQEVLSKYFSKVLYGVVSYNAWFDEASYGGYSGVVGFQKKGPLILGSKNNSLQEELYEVCSLFSKGVQTIPTQRFQDVARSKMVINLTNSLTTLIGHGFKPVTNADLFQRLLTQLTYEGVQILKAAGYNECTLGGMPSWKKIKAGARLPLCLTRSMFQKNVSKMVKSSMAQDILQRGGKDSELDSLNGYFLELARKHNVKAPFNEAIYKLCKSKFAEPEFVPMSIEEVWQEVQKLHSR